APEPRLPDAGGDLLGASVKPDGQTPQLLSVFFPSLSTDILWKLGAVSRVRSAAQKARALDTAPSFQQNPADKKAKGRSSEPKPRVRGLTAAKLKPMTPPALAYCGQKMVLTMGSTLVLASMLRM